MTQRTATARLDPDGVVVLVVNDRFTQRFPVADLPRWLRFYRALWAGQRRDAPESALQRPGPCARFYAPTVQALDDLQKAMVMP